MLAHRYFPDLSGALDGEIDGEITGKWGRPKRPGAWVTDLARAYQQAGVPRVMQVLLESLEESTEAFTYQRVERELSESARQVGPEQFWDALQELLCMHAAAAPHERAGEEDSPTQQTVPAFEHEGMTAGKAIALVARIVQEGAPYHISAQPRSNGGDAWIVEMRVEVEDGTQREPGGVKAFTSELRSEQEWVAYFKDMKELED
jgi:hypothetical protein